MRRNRPLSEQAVAVILRLAEDAAVWRHGYELCRETGIKAGSMYPILIGLADKGWLETKWETAIPLGRPPRHLYRLTDAGLEHAGELAAARREAERAKRARLRPRLGTA
ncbi:MAG: PadR family transcriptional regulator [Bryobacter sp.]|jgi:DNA-binding PadR family transcriptional regulator|nr:PadR family transcriptional regulator [Bryobacter sp.]